MSGAANLAGDAKAESFMKALEAEEIDAKTCRTIDEARRGLGARIGEVHNGRRLHAVLGDKPPIAFQAQVWQIQARELNPPTPMSRKWPYLRQGAQSGAVNAI